jgi:hypothetical protein
MSKRKEMADGAAFDDHFESIGKKANHLTTGETESEDDQRVVDEIESLCMNCREDVSIIYFPVDRRFTNLRL